MSEGILQFGVHAKIQLSPSQRPGPLHSGISSPAGLEPLKWRGTLELTHRLKGNSSAAKEDRAAQTVQLHPSSVRLGLFLAHAPTSWSGGSYLFAKDDQVPWAGAPKDRAGPVELQAQKGTSKVPA